MPPLRPESSTEPPASNRPSAPLTVKHQPGDILIELFDDQGENVADVYVYPGLEQEALATARRMAAAEQMAAALSQFVRHGHTAGCTQITMPSYPCSKRCRMTREALSAARGDEGGECG